MKDNENVVMRHEAKLAKVETILERVATNQDKMAEALGKVTASMSKQELLFEKLANIDMNTKTSFDRVHARVDDIEKQREKDSEVIDSKLDKLKPVFTILDYPRAAIASIIGIYVLVYSQTGIKLLDSGLKMLGF